MAGRKPVVTQVDVFQAADAISSGGGSPTIDAVYAFLGRKGSRTTLANHLRTWRERNPPDDVTQIPGMPESLTADVAQVWRTLVHQAYEKAKAELSAYRIKIDEDASKSVDAAEKRAAQAEESRRAIAEDMALLDQRQDQIEQARSQAAAECNRLSRELERMKRQYGRHQVKARGIHEAQKERIQQLEARNQSDAEKASALHSQLQKQLDDATDRYDADTESLLVKIESARQETKAAKSESRKEIESLRQALEANQKALAETEQQRKSSEQATKHARNQAQTERNQAEVAQGRLHQQLEAEQSARQVAEKDRRAADERLAQVLQSLNVANEKIWAFKSKSEENPGR